MQAPCDLHSEKPEEEAVRGVAQESGWVFQRLPEQKESRKEEGHLMPDHVHMLIAIPPKYAARPLMGS